MPTSTVLPFEADTKYEGAERFVGWLADRAIADNRGDDLSQTPVDPAGLFWLGRLCPKDLVTAGDRGERMEPCALGVRARPRASGACSVRLTARCVVWRRQSASEGTSRFWLKSAPVIVTETCEIIDASGDQLFGEAAFAAEFARIGAPNLSARFQVRQSTRRSQPSIEFLFVNTSTEAGEFVRGKLFECSLEVGSFEFVPFELEALPDSFRYDRSVDAYGVNCGVEALDAETLRTTDAPTEERLRPEYWGSDAPEPDLRFASIADDPVAVAEALVAPFDVWVRRAWDLDLLDRRGREEGWSQEMVLEARHARDDAMTEVERVRNGAELLARDPDLRRAFAGMNRAMLLSAREKVGARWSQKYDRWRPFQFAFLLANLRSLVDPAERDVVDVVWFATGGGKTETYLGLLVTAALLDRATGKSCGVTAWSRFPLRMLSLQQTQRFANALAGAEIVRREEQLGGDSFSLGFLVGGGATPNRVVEDAGSNDKLWDPDRLEALSSPFRLLEVCPFCRSSAVETSFDRASWRLEHLCRNDDCEWGDGALPFYVVDDELWRFLPTIVVGTLDKAANIARSDGMRGMLGSPRALCSRSDHGFVYAPRANRRNGCLVPGCAAQSAPLPMPAARFSPTFRLQDELHLLRDSLGAVDAHYEAALDGIQATLSGSSAKILASSATLSGYEKQVDVLYRRSARVFPQPPPEEGAGFWTRTSGRAMRRYMALSPRGLTIEFAVDRLVVSLQRTVRELLADPSAVCGRLGLDAAFAPFLLDLYGTDVVYGNTLRDLDAVVRSSETQYVGIDGLNRATLTGRTAFEEVMRTLERLQSPEADFADRVHLVAASSMMSHGVDVDRLNVMVMLGLPLGVAEFIQATARVGRRWPALVVVVPKATRERDASVYRSFSKFVSHGDRFVEPIPITRNSRRVLERTISGMELARLLLVHEPEAAFALTTPAGLRRLVTSNPRVLHEDEEAIASSLRMGEDDRFLRETLRRWFDRFRRNLDEPPAGAKFVSDLTSEQPMTSLRDVEEQVPVFGADDA